MGARDLAGNAVTSAKIGANQVGRRNVIAGQVQLRVSGACTAGSSIASIKPNGTVTCDTTPLPVDQSTPGLSEALLPTASAPTVLASEQINGQASQVTAAPYIQVGGDVASQNVVVTCSLAAKLYADAVGGPVPTAVSTNNQEIQTRSATFTLGTGHEQAATSIPLTITLPGFDQAAAAYDAASEEIGVSCTTANDANVAPMVQAASGIDAVGLSKVTSTPTSGTSTGTFTITTPGP